MGPPGAARRAPRRRLATSASSSGADETPRRAAPRPRLSPYQLSSMSLSPRNRRGAAPSQDPPRSPLAWKTRSASPRAARARRSGSRARRRARARRGRCRSARRACPGIRAASAAMKQPTTPAPTTAMRSPRRGPASHSALTAVSMLAASAARASGTSSGTGSDGVGRHDVAILMRIKAEDAPAAQRRASRFDDADRGVAVFHRRREIRPPGTGSASPDIRSAARGPGRRGFRCRG